MAVRFAVRLGTRRPLPASSGNALLDRLAPLAHHGLYVLAVLMAASGVAPAALYHQFVRRDGLLRRMAFGKR
jgi:cytochrome b561